jgi:diguanylate cyclase (GGDEF)-like protein/PAS domain S-box-containing protein
MKKILSALSAKIDALIKPGTNAHIQDFSYWRDYIFRFTLVSAVFFGMITFVITIMVSLDSGDYHVIAVYAIAYSWLCAITFIKKISYRLRALVTTALFYFIGLLFIYPGAHYQTALIWLFIFPILCSLLFGMGATLVSLLINAATFAIIGVLVHDEVIMPQCTLNAWVITTVNFIIINAITALSISFLLLNTRKLIDRENSARADLSLEHARLAEANAALRREIEERRNIEERLNDEKIRYKSVFENTGAATLLLSRDLEIEMLNSQAEILCGLVREKVIGTMNFMSFVADHDRERIVQHHLIHAQNTARPDSYEFDFVDAAGRIKSVTAMVSRIPGTETRIMSLLDITDIKEIRDTLNKKEELLTLALEATSDAIWDWFPQTGKTFFSPRYYTMLGYLPYEMPQHYETWLTLIHPDERDSATSAVASQLREGGDSFTIEFRARTKSGEWKWISGKGTVIDRDEKGRPLRIVGTHVDITDQKQILDSLLNSEKKYRTLYNNALVGMFSFRKSDSICLSINQLGCRLLGHKDSETIVGADTIMREHFDENSKQEIARLLASEGEINTLEMQITRANGVQFWILLSMKLNEQEDRIDCFFVDITRRKKAEDQLHNLMFYDQLTRLPNKEMFINRLAIEIVRAHRRNQSFAVICLGLDNFKKINEIHGQKTGDRILIEIGSILTDTFRSDDLISRFSGDQFMVLLSDIGSSDDLMEIVKKARESLSREFVINNIIFTVTASMGITLYPHDGDSGDLLIKNSESAMFVAKDQGKNGYVMFDQQMHDQIIKFFEIEEAMRRAIINDEFLPTTSPRSTARAGFWAWKRSSGGNRPPWDSFLRANSSISLKNRE